MFRDQPTNSFLRSFSALSFVFSVVVLTSCGFEIRLKGTLDSRSELTSEMIAAIESGKTLYSKNCTSCHGALEVTPKRNRTAEQIREAIHVIPNMKFLESLTSPEVNAIAMALSTDPQSTPSTPSSPTLACTTPQARGADNQRLRRLSRTEVLASLSGVFGPALMGIETVQSRAAGVPEDQETKAVVSPTTTYENALGYTNLFDELTTEVFRTEASARKFGGDCIYDNPDLTCARSFINRMGILIQRRILKESEVSDYIARITSGDTAGYNAIEQFKLVLMRLLLSPDFLFQIEEGFVPGRSLSLRSSDFSRYYNGTTTAGVSTAETINNQGEWLVHVNSPGRADGDPIYNKIYNKLIVVASAKPGADGSYPWFQVDWNLRPVESRADITRTKGSNQIFVFEGEFGYMMNQNDTARAQIYKKFQLGFNMRANSGATGANLTIEAIALVNESGTPAPEGNRLRLSPLEVANRIAFRMSDGGPDARLLTAALRDELQTVTQVDAHARRMLQTAPGQAKMIAVFREYTKLNRHLPPSANLSSQQLNGLDVNGINIAMMNEFEDYIKNQVFEAKASFLNVMTSPAAYPRTPALASIYGSSVWNGSAAQTQYSPTHRGLLNRAAFLYNGSARTSPILRGVAIRKAILCDPVDSPDPNIVAVREAGLDGLSIDQLSTRSLVTSMTGGKECMTCHRNINPLGFALESFDSFGRFRTTEQIFSSTGQILSSHQVDASATDMRIGDGSPENANGALDLVDTLANSEKAKACFTRKLVQQAVRRELAATDGCMMTDVYDALRETNTSVFDALVKSVSSEDIFFTRTGI